MPFGFADGAGQIAGLVDGICVDEEEPLALCGLSSGPAGVVFSGEAAAVGEVEGWRGEDGDAGMGGGGLGCDGCGGVGGVVVDDDELPLQSEGEAWFGLLEDGGEAVGEGLLLVAGGQDDRELIARLFGVFSDGFRIVRGREVGGVHDFVL